MALFGKVDLAYDNERNGWKMKEKQALRVAQTGASKLKITAQSDTTLLWVTPQERTKKPVACAKGVNCRFKPERCLFDHGALRPLY